MYSDIEVIWMLCFLTLSEWQGQVKGFYFQCLLIGTAEGSDSRVISLMMMSYHFSWVPQVHTYLWCAAPSTPARKYLFNTGLSRMLTKAQPQQNDALALIEPVPLNLHKPQKNFFTVIYTYSCTENAIMKTLWWQHQPRYKSPQYRCQHFMLIILLFDH